MAVEPPIPPQAISGVTKLLQQLVIAQRDTAVATLVAAAMGSAGRRLSINEIMALERDIRWSLYPEDTRGDYKAWQKDAADRLKAPVA